MAKVTLGAVLLMWTFTLFLAMFWHYLPDYLNLKVVFLFLALISSVISFKVTVTRKF